MDIQYNTVVLAALLHDIGKLYQKGNADYISTRGKHPEVSINFINKFKSLFEKFVDINMLQELVLKHHENSRNFPESMLIQKADEKYKKFAYLISCADNFSSKKETLRAMKKRIIKQGRWHASSAVYL